MKKILARLLITGFVIAFSCAIAQARELLTFTAESLTVDWTATVAKDSLGPNHAMQLTPMLVSGADTLALEPVIFRSRLNSRVTERARLFNDLPAASCPELLTGQEAALGATLTRQDYPGLWAGDVRLVVERQVSGCCETREMPPLSLATARYVEPVEPFKPVVAPVPDFTGKAGQLQRDNPVLQHISQYRPYDTTRILRKEEGSLYVHFPLDKWEVRTDFRSNGATLDTIIDLTRQIMADTTSSVKVIQIVGLASVEGRLQHNIELAGNRAEALKSYIQAHVDVPDALFECNNGGEAWTELRDQVADLDFPYRARLLEIIDTEPDPNRRESRIRALDGGKAYAYLRENVLSDQRNSGYLRIYYDYVPDEAAAIINGVSSLLAQEQYEQALAALLPVKADSRAWNALGVALYMSGDTEGALDYFRRAAAQGNAEAQTNLDQLLEYIKLTNN